MSTINTQTSPSILEQTSSSYPFPTENIVEEDMEVISVSREAKAILFMLRKSQCHLPFNSINWKETAIIQTKIDTSIDQSNDN